MCLKAQAAFDVCLRAGLSCLVLSFPCLHSILPDRHFAHQNLVFRCDVTPQHMCLEVPVPRCTYVCFILLCALLCVVIVLGLL